MEKGAGIAIRAAPLAGPVAANLGEGGIQFVDQGPGCQ